MLNLPFLSGQKFIFTIGDDGAILTLVNKNKVENRLFCPSPALSDRREVNALLTKYPTIPIYVLLDSIEQTYAKQTLPAVSALNIGKLMKKRLDRDFAKTDIKGAIPMGRDTTGRRDWFYMFVSTPATPVIIEWLDYLSSLANPFTGIYLLPVEMESFVQKLNKVLFKTPEEKKKWQFIVTHNKTGGFRQTILQNDKVVFTRLIRPGKDSLTDIIAGNIEQEIINTVDYLRRLGLSDEENINVVAVVSKELKASLETSKIRGKPMMLFTPHEIAKILGCETVVAKEDKFADILIANIFAGSKPILKLPNPKAKGLNNLLVVYKLSSVAMIAIVPIIAIYSGVLVFNILSMNSKIKKVENEKAQIEQQWKDVKNTGEYNIDDANKITDAISLRKRLGDDRQNPMEFIAKLAQIKTNFIMLQSLSWSYDKDYSATNKPGIVSTIFNLEFSTKGSSLDEMFRNYDIMSEAINKEFKDYTIDISKLPDRITFDEKTENLPIQVKIVSKPKEGAGEPPQEE